MAAAGAIRRWFSSDGGASDRLIPRWIFLRALGLIYFSAFFSLVFQIKGEVGPHGILPAGDYLKAVAQALHAGRYWYAPTLLWFNSGSHMLMALCWVGMIAAIVLTVNIWPRAMLVVCFVCYLSFIAAAGDFASYQSDGMLLEAGFISLFFTAPGFLPGLGKWSPPSRASLFLLQWEWFRIYFESGIAKLVSGDPEWRHLTAMDEYYQNGPLPTWIGWYVQHLPHGFQAFTAGATLVMELGLVWMLFFPRRIRIICFFIVTPWEIGVILTANYCFLNYLVLSLGFLLLDDRFIGQFLPRSWSARILLVQKAPAATAAGSVLPVLHALSAEPKAQRADWRRHWSAFKLALATVMLSWIFYSTTVQLLWMLAPALPFPRSPVAALDPFRIANQYGLFAVMTRGRYEIEFQGSSDGQNWTPYPFRYKPQDVYTPPGIYAPYQPRFDWNLWFASLTTWRHAPIVPNTEIRLLSNDPDVLALFAGNPFAKSPPKQVRAVLWQYWFTSMQEKRQTGKWWRRQLIGPYAPTLELKPNGELGVVEENQPRSP
ncbi:MAG TPA: lipase maturation factor family protein [Terriglobales bacterium]|nr:lipase maturation factor family protein [Terriglobales bacterium]